MEEEAIVLSEADTPKEIPSGFRVVKTDGKASGWLYDCEVCHYGAVSSTPLKPGKPVQVFCCGKLREFIFNRRQIWRLPVFKRTLVEMLPAPPPRDFETEYHPASAF